jgi:hypothetical protein
MSTLRSFVLAGVGFVLTAAAASAQAPAARQVLEEAAAAMGGLQRLQGIMLIAIGGGSCSRICIALAVKTMSRLQSSRNGSN